MLREEPIKRTSQFLHRIIIHEFLAPGVQHVKKSPDSRCVENKVRICWSCYDKMVKSQSLKTESKSAEEVEEIFVALQSIATPP